MAYSAQAVHEQIERLAQLLDLGGAELEVVLRGALDRVLVSGLVQSSNVWRFSELLSLTWSLTSTRPTAPCTQALLVDKCIRRGRIVLYYVGDKF